MNYASVEELLASGIENMTVIRNNSKQDDGVDTVQGVDWFKYNGVVASNIYVSGNSFIGFGSNEEHLKVNRRDGAMYYLYREEGTLNNKHRFLKIRWEGTTYYNSNTYQYKLAYDVILWSTGDISLHLVSYPTSYNTGTYALGSYSYTLNLTNKDVTFIKTNSGFDVSNAIIELPEIRYLVRSNSIYYTISDGVLIEIGNIEITSDTFLTHGIEKISDLTLLSNLTNPELVYWSSKNLGELGEGVITINGAPPLPQITYYNAQNIPSEFTSISNVEAIANNALFTITFDNGVSWKYFNGNEWVRASTASEGMSVNMIAAISKNKWAEVTTSRSFQFRCSLMSLDSTAGKIAVGYE